MSVTMQGCMSHRPPPLLIDIQRFSQPSIRGEFRGLLEPCSLFSAKHFSVFTQNRGANVFVISVEESRHMNVGLDIKDAVLTQRMSHWRIRGKYGPMDNCTKRRGRKNYLYLVRKYKSLAQQHNFRESDVY
jgi:hypothetical protein